MSLIRHTFDNCTIIEDGTITFHFDFFGAKKSFVVNSLKKKMGRTEILEYKVRELEKMKKVIKEKD